MFERSNFRMTYEEEYWQRMRGTSKQTKTLYSAQAYSSAISLLEVHGVLDVGCGFGDVVKALQPVVNRAEGIEISKYAVQNSVAKNSVKLYDGSIFPYKDNEFDAILCLDVFEHLTKSQLLQMLEEIARVAKPNAFLFFVVPLHHSPSFYLDSTHKLAWTADQWKKILNKYGSVSVFSPARGGKIRRIPLKKLRKVIYEWLSKRAGKKALIEGRFYGIVKLRKS